MDINYIIEFVSLASNRSYLETAEEMFISQPTLSKHIKTLENELGVTLFDRNTRKVVLNEQGKLFLPYAKQIADSFQQYKSALHRLEQNIHAALTIGTIPNSVPYHIMECIDQFQKCFSDIHVCVNEGSSDMLIEMLCSRQCDYIFIRKIDQLEGTEIEYQKFAEDTLVAVLPENHPLAKQSSVTLNQLKQEPFLLLGNHSAVANISLEACRKCGFMPNIVYRSSHGGNLVNQVLEGRGVALLTKLPAQQFLRPGIVTIPISPAIATDIYVCWNRETLNHSGKPEFFNFLQSFLSCHEIS